MPVGAELRTNVTIETVVDPALGEQFLRIYRAAFDPLEDLAAARQALTDDEFREEMREESILKFVGWDRRGVPVALLVFATDLDLVPWISPEFWRKRYPEHAARKAIYYYGALLVSPEVRGGLWVRRLLREAMVFTASNRAIAAFDCCQYNVDEMELPRVMEELGRTISHLETEQVDVQTYYAYHFDGLLEEPIDLRRPAVREVDTTLDLR